MEEEKEILLEIENLVATIKNTTSSMAIYSSLQKLKQLLNKLNLITNNQYVSDMSDLEIRLEYEGAKIRSFIDATKKGELRILNDNTKKVKQMIEYDLGQSMKKIDELRESQKD